MATTELHISDVMTRDPETIGNSGTVLQAARCMRDQEIGEVIVCNDDGTICGVVTDRDLVIRCLAEGLDPESTRIEQVFTPRPETIGADDDVHRAASIMRGSAIRRLPVLDGDGKPIGIVSIGDLAVTMDQSSALADISRAAPNN
jgi:CBS domain-containing protein